jgi:hypothetical protein
MHPVDAYRNVLAMVRGGHLDVGAITPKRYPLTELRAAMETAASAGNLESVVVVP